MPQIINVIRCFSCNTFQSQIEKKSKKWVCVVCGEKQSLKRTYGSGSGKDCRLLAQELNSKRMKEDEDTELSIENNNGMETEQEKLPIEKESVNANGGIKESKWSKYLEEDCDDEEG